MRGKVIVGLLGLLVFIIVLDFETTTDSSPPAGQSLLIYVTPTVSPPDTALEPTVAAPDVLPTAAPVEVALAATVDVAQLETYSIQSGDTPYKIAQRFGVQVDRLMRLNDIADPTKLRVGQVIVIPQPDTDILAVQTVMATHAVMIPPDLTTVTPLAAAFVPDASTINGLPFDSFIILPDGVKQHIRAIYAQGQALGNNPRAFTMLGDSTIEYPYFLARFDEGPYNLGAYAYLQPVIDYFAGSFAHQSVAIRRGLHTWSVLDPMWAPKPACQTGENMLACEFRLQHPSLLFIRLGSNDAGIPETTDKDFRQIVQFAIDQGVIPIIGTKADRHEDANNTNNNIMRQVAADYQIPLMDFDVVAQTAPGRGLDQDNVHMTTFYAHDYTDPTAFQRGHSLHNLTALTMLDQIWHVLEGTES
ncbi:MAG: LysM peptidoglycan-binding domain-containing protein [Anaerolineae bacterium]|nr:LysM peptidoglycan-binding domain-containing protein [Anaerolineae bacterium]